MSDDCEAKECDRETLYARWEGDVYAGFWCAEHWKSRKRDSDPVNSPDHYRWLPLEAIEVTEHFNFCLGNALKYILRADHKGKPIEDLKKARWYIDREIARRVANDKTSD